MFYNTFQYNGVLYTATGHSLKTYHSAVSTHKLVVLHYIIQVFLYFWSLGVRDMLGTNKSFNSATLVWTNPAALKDFCM